MAAVATVVVVVMTKLAWIVVPHGMVKVITSLLAATSKDITAARALAAGIVAVLVLVLNAVAAVIMSVTVVLVKAILEVNWRPPLP